MSDAHHGRPTGLGDGRSVDGVKEVQFAVVSALKAIVVGSSHHFGRSTGDRSVSGMTAMDPAPETESQDSLALAPDEIGALEEADPTPEPVSYSGADFDVEGLVRRLDRGDIVIPTFGHGDDTIETAGFQRSFVWRRPQMDRFIESLLLGYPIPGIFLVQQVDKRYLVLDGQQRLRTLSDFFVGIHRGREFALQNVADEFKGLTYKTLPDTLRRTLNNTFIQATVVKTDGTTGSLDAVYQIFERLNAGGTQLTPHEIRVALYAGKFVDFLTELNSESSWRELYGPESPRLRDQELVLRFVALFVSPGTYKRPLKKFLNEFVGANRDLSSISAADIARVFATATDLLLRGPGGRAFRGGGRQVNAALAESTLVGLARRLESGTPPAVTDVTAAVDALAADQTLEAVISRATADEENVRARLSITTQAFARLP